MLLEKRDSNFENQIFILQNKLKNNLFDEVIQKAKLLLKKHRHERKILNGIPMLYNIISLAYQSKLDYNNSIRIMDEALKLNPKNIFYLNNMGISQHKNKDFFQAEKYFKRALEIDPNYINVLNNLANLKKDLDKVDEAIKYYEKSVSLNNNILITNYNLSSMYVQKGEYNKAVSYLEKTLKINPKFTTADRTLSLITKYEKNNKHFIEMKEKKINLKLENMEMVELNFALGKAYEDRGDYEKSFQNYQEGNSTKKQFTKFDLALFHEECTNQKEVCTNDLFEQKKDWGLDSKEPIFILGLPRVGSTLLEQILSSHSQVEATHELPNILALSHKLNLRKVLDKTSRYPDILLSLSAPQLKLIGEHYINDAEIFRSNKPYFIDKMPNNFRHIGLIKLILPNAKIIDIRRSSMSACFSCYKQLFAEGQEFTYDFKDLAGYYNNYVELMDHWNHVLPNQILSIDYENLVNNFEESVHNILDYCNLDFEESCLNFYKSKRSVRTPSSEQVRQPIYKSGLDYWKNYESYLGDLKKDLRY